MSTPTHQPETVDTSWARALFMFQLTGIKCPVYYFDFDDTPRGGSKLAGPATFRVFEDADHGTTAVHMYTRDMNDRNKTGVYRYSLKTSPPKGFSGGAVSFHAYASQGQGRVPVWEYTQPGCDPRKTELYLYSTNHSERGWQRGPEAFWALPG